MSLKTRLFLLIAATALLGGCGKRLITTHIEDSIQARLPELIGPAQSYTVEVAGNTSNIVKGRMREIRIYGQKVSITPALTIDELRVTLRGVDFDKHSQSIRNCASTTFEATVQEPTLDAYLRAVRPDMDDLGVKLKKDKMLVHLRPSVLKISFGVELEGPLRVVEPAKVYFSVDRLSLAGLNMPGTVADYVEKKINPVQDFSSTGMKVRLSSVRVLQGALHMKGTVDLGSGLPAH